MRKALEHRTDLEQARRQIDSNDVTLRFMRNQTLPALDLLARPMARRASAARSSSARAAASAARSSARSPAATADALRTLTGRDYPTWNFQLNLSAIRSARARRTPTTRAARVQLNQSTAQLRALELQVATDVTNAALQVENGLTRYEAAVAARELAQTRLEAEQSRFDVGLSTNFFVVQAQRDLATAQNSELRALLDYRRALVDFQRVQEAPANRGGGITAINAAGAAVTSARSGRLIS